MSRKVDILWAARRFMEPNMMPDPFKMPRLMLEAHYLISRAVEAECIATRDGTDEEAEHR